MGKTLVCGPWFGEIGLFVVWLAGCRYAAQHGDYAQVIVIGPDGWGCLCEDFATVYVPHPFKGIIACGSVGKHGTQPSDEAIEACRREAAGCEDFDVFPAVETHKVGSHPGNMFLEPMGKNATFVRHGANRPTFAQGIVLHARWRQDWGGDRNWAPERWAECMGLLRAAFPDRAFGSIGSREGAMHVGGTVDMRGRCVADVCDALANALCIVGPSSGPMHLASLCACPQVTWVGEEPLKQDILAKRYIERYPTGWNAHGVDVACILSEDWNPSPSDVAEQVIALAAHVAGTEQAPLAVPAPPPARPPPPRQARMLDPPCDEAVRLVSAITPPIGIGVICYRNPEDVDRCLRSIEANAPPNHYGLAILDNSENDTAVQKVALGFLGTYLAPWPQVGCWRGRNLFWALAEAQGYPAFVVIDSDVVVTDDDWLDRMLAKMNEHPDAAMVGWRTANILGRSLGSQGEIVEMPGMCALYRTEAVRDVGGWDRDFHPFHSGDTDFCLRVTTQADHPRFASRPWQCYLVDGEPAIRHEHPHSGVDLNPDHDAIVQRSMDTLARKTKEYRAMGIDYPVMENIRDRVEALR